MKTYTHNELKQIYNDINNGVVYCGIRNNYGTGRIYKDGKYIRWEHFGSSCEKNTIHNLQWLIENIFEDCDIITPTEYSEYYVNYIPVDKQYNAIDFSCMHPNVYGL